MIPDVPVLRRAAAIALMVGWVACSPSAFCGFELFAQPLAARRGATAAPQTLEPGDTACCARRGPAAEPAHRSSRELLAEAAIPAAHALPSTPTPRREPSSRTRAFAPDPPLVLRI